MPEPGPGAAAGQAAQSDRIPSGRDSAAARGRHPAGRSADPATDRPRGPNGAGRADDSADTDRSGRGLLNGPTPVGMPSGLLARIRWLFLLYALVSVAVNAIQLGLVSLAPISGTAATGREWLVRGVAALTLGWLAWYWYRGYRKGSFSLPGDLAAAGVLYVVGYALASPARMLSLVYASVFFRALYGEPRRVIAWTCMAFAAMLAATTFPLQAENVTMTVVQLPTLAFVTGLVLLVARIVTQSERAVNRERVLSRAGVTLVKAQGPAALYASALESVMTMLEGVPRTQVTIWEGTHEDMQVGLAAGVRSEEMERHTLRVRTMPEPLRSALREGRQVSATDSEATRWSRALGCSRPGGAVLVQPLVTRNDLRTVLIVISKVPLPSELSDALEALAAQVGLVGKLLQSERRFRSVVQNSSDVVTVVGPDATVRYVSPSVERVFGYKPAELLGVWLDDLAHPDDRAALLGYLYTASRQPTADDAVQWRWRDREGVWRDVETVGTNLVHMPDVAGVVLNSRDVSERKSLERERAQLLDKTVQASEEERIRIAGDLHDGPIQRLTTMGYDLARAHRWLEKRETAKGMEILEATQQQLSEEINGLREMMAELRPPVLDEVGLEAALREHMKLFGNRAGVRCELESSVGGRLDPELETVLYRVSQEALNNVAKHARAKNLHIALRTGNGATELAISDDGVGFSTADINSLSREGHFGLVSMRQRVEMAGGRFNVASTPGEGVTITAHFTDAEHPQQQPQQQPS